MTLLMPDFTWRPHVHSVSRGGAKKANQVRQALRRAAGAVSAMSGVMIRHLLSRAAPGQIVNIASVAGRVDYQARSACCASKFAVIG